MVVAKEIVNITIITVVPSFIRLRFKCRKSRKMSYLNLI